MSRSRNLDRVTRYQWFESGFLQQTVRLSGRQCAAVENPDFSRGTAGHGRRGGRQRPAQAGDVTPIGGNVSAGLNSSTAMPVMSSRRSQLLLTGNAAIG